MPARPRSELIDHDEPGIYHCWNRIGRGRFLWGKDKFTQKDFSYRKLWVREQFVTLAADMAIQVLDYAVLDNHLHVVLRNRPDLVAAWSDDEVAKRWWRICPKRRKKDGSPADPKPSELQALKKDILEYRNRLSSISWIMRLAQQRVARRANQEDRQQNDDQALGKFFADRFGCARLVDEASVLNCSLYVDLNLIHAGCAKTPEESLFTSAYERIITRCRSESTKSVIEMRGDYSADDEWLAPIYLDERSGQHRETGGTAKTGSEPTRDSNGLDPRPTTNQQEKAIEKAFSNPIGSQRVSNKGFLPMTLDQYLELLDLVGRRLRRDKRGSIPGHLAPILKRLNLRPKQWLKAIVDQFRRQPGLTNLVPC